ncbi:MAG: hypothetical protein FWF59_12130 [Turicibacter sp.]|nr:hypothetical protein [Turicibacter sp.]
MDNLDWMVLARESSTKYFGDAPLRGGAGRAFTLAEPLKEVVAKPIKQKVTQTIRREAVKRTAKEAIKKMPWGITPMQGLQVALIIFIIAFMLGFIQGLKAGALLASTKGRK